MCGHCRNSVLIDGYREELFWGIRIKCFRCDFVSETPGVELGEVMPIYRIVVASTPREINSTINCESAGRFGLCYISEREEFKERESAWPRDAQAGAKYKPSSVTLDDKFLDWCIQSAMSLLEASSPHNKQNDPASSAKAEIETRLKSARRSVVHEYNTGANEHTLLWATELIRGQLRKRHVDLRDRSQFRAYASLLSFFEVWDHWAHHALFSQVADGLMVPGSFDHTIAQFILNNWLFNQKMIVGFRRPQNTTPTSDSYIWNWPFEKLAIEIKSSAALYTHVNVALRAEEITRNLKRAMKSAKGQITSLKRGVVVFFPGFTRLNPDYAEKQVKAVIQSSGRNYRGVAALAIMCLTEDAILVDVDNRNVSPPSFAFRIALNPYFEGPNPIGVEGSQATPFDEPDPPEIQMLLRQLKVRSWP